MEKQVSLLFRPSLCVSSATVQANNGFCTLGLVSEGPDGEKDFGNTATLFFFCVEDIETLVDALQKLGNDFAAAPIPEEALLVEEGKK